MEDPTELHEAASLGDYELLENLLLKGQYDVDSEDWTYERKTPLHVAVESGEVFLKFCLSNPIEIPIAIPKTRYQL